MSNTIAIPDKMRKRPVVNGIAVPVVADFLVETFDENVWFKCCVNFRCPFCGEPVGRFLFVCGDKYDFRRMDFRCPPGHLECVVYALQAYPQIFTLGVLMPKEIDYYVLARVLFVEVSEDQQRVITTLDGSYPPQKVYRN